MDKPEKWLLKWADWIDTPQGEAVTKVVRYFYTFIWVFLAFFAVVRISGALWQVLNHHWEKAWNLAKGDVYGLIGFIIYLFICRADMWKKRQS